MIEECFTFMSIQENHGRSKLDVNLQQRLIISGLRIVLQQQMHEMVLTRSIYAKEDLFNSTEKYLTKNSWKREKTSQHKQFYQEIQEYRCAKCEHYKLNWKMLDSASYHLRSTFSLHPFFISYATDKEMALCMCKLCLNAKLLDNVLMVQAKTDGDDSNNLIAHFLCTVVIAQSPLISNDYYRWKCAKIANNFQKMKKNT